jgi:hypothetical protein
VLARTQSYAPSTFVASPAQTSAIEPSQEKEALVATTTVESAEAPLTQLATPVYASEGEGGEEGGELAWWLAALAAVIGITIAVIILARREETETIAGFEIESDSRNKF